MLRSAMILAAVLTAPQADSQQVVPADYQRCVLIKNPPLFEHKRENGAAPLADLT